MNDLGHTSVLQFWKYQMTPFKTRQIEQEAYCDPTQSQSESTQAWSITDELFVSDTQAVSESTPVEAMNIKIPGKRCELHYFTLTLIGFVAKKGPDLRALIHGAGLDVEDVCNVENGD